MLTMLHEIVRLLKGGGGYVSGEKISAALGITRAAVWKKIETLRQKGFVIEALPSRGYRLLRSPDLSVEEVLSGVKSDFWKKVLLYDTVGSTNELAASLSATGLLAPGTVIIADAQEHGKGRLGRSWLSPPGVNIYMSVILLPEIGPRDVTLLTLLSAVACAAAIRGESGIQASIKWPNDLMVSGRKIGGILTEVKTDPDRITLAIIGIGLNVNIGTAEFPEEIRALATSLKAETGRRFPRGGIIVHILKEIEYWCEVLKKDGRIPLLEEWKRLSSTLGKEVRVATASGTIQGTAEDIDDEGMLIVRLSSGEEKRISAGDVTVLR
jgi:BirA family transcriptional regulator, biotin operon repressor / biotin---[acetyl-CoA-carboxylase] ligase